MNRVDDQVERSTLIGDHRTPGRMPLAEARAAAKAHNQRGVVQLSSKLALQLDHQAYREDSNRASIVKKALSTYLALAEGKQVPFSIVYVRAAEEWAPDTRPGEHHQGRVTVQLGPDLAAEVDAQAAKERTSRGALAKKAAEMYLREAAGKQDYFESRTLIRRIALFKDHLPIEKK